MKQILMLILMHGLITQNLFGMLTFSAFPGINATDIAVDSQGRTIVAGSRNNTSQSSIVRYTTTGTIETIYEPFPGGIVNAIAIDPRDQIIAVGDKGAVVRYGTNGKINQVFTKFPGQRATAITLDQSGFFFVVGSGGVIVEYLNEQPLLFREVRAFSFATKQLVPFTPFPGQLATCCTINELGRLIIGGQNGTIVEYITPTDLRQYQPFPGQSVKALVPLPTEFTTLGMEPNVLAVGAQSTVVEYNRLGNILKTYTPFPGVLAEDVILNLNFQRLVCGLEGTVIQYNENGTINRIYQKFPSPSAQSLAINQLNQPIVVGKQSAVAQYNDAGSISNFKVQQPTEGEVIVSADGAIPLQGIGHTFSTVAFFLNDELIEVFRLTVIPTYFLGVRNFPAGQYTLKAVGIFNQGKVNYASQTVNFTLIVP